jgi:hypothetical protein
MCHPGSFISYALISDAEGATVMQMKIGAKPLPPLEVGQAYRLMDIERFEYFHQTLTGEVTILRLKLKNATTIDLPASDDQLRHLRNILNAAYPQT